MAMYNSLKYCNNQVKYLSQQREFKVRQLSKGGITTANLFVNTSKAKKTALEAGGKLQAAICDCGPGKLIMAQEPL
jgi:hypothetical protein